MNDIRRTILWVVFGFSMVLLWDQWQVHTGQKATFFPGPSQSAPAAPKADASGAAGVPSSVPVPSVVAAPVAEIVVKHLGHAAMVPAYQAIERIEMRDAFLQAGRTIVQEGAPLFFEDDADPFLEHPRLSAIHYRKIT